MKEKNMPGPRLPQRFGRLARRMDELFRGYRLRRTMTYWISQVRQCPKWAQAKVNEIQWLC